MLKAITQLVYGSDRPIPEFLQFAKRAGYEGVELVMTMSGDLNLEATRDDYARIKGAGRESGIAFTSICAGGGVRPDALVTSPDPAMRRAARDAFAKCCEAGEALGIGALLVVPGVVTAEIQYDVAVDRAREELSKLAPVAANHGVVLCVENVWNKMFMSPTEMRDFVDSIDSPSVQAFLDVGNMLIWGFPEHWVRILGARTHRVHFKDFRRQGYEFVQLMDGDVDWPAVMAALRDTGYDGPVIQEVGGSEEELIETRRRMEQILAM